MKLRRNDDSDDDIPNMDCDAVESGTVGTITLIILSNYIFLFHLENSVERAIEWKRR